MEIDHSIVVAHGWCKTTHKRLQMEKKPHRQSIAKNNLNSLRHNVLIYVRVFLLVSLSLFFHLLCWFALAVLLYYCIASIFKQFAMHSLANLRVITAFCFCCFSFFVRLSVDLIESICLLNLRI